MARAGYGAAATRLWREARRTARRPEADRTLRVDVLRARAALAAEQGRPVRRRALAAAARLAAARSAQGAA
jgi:hypothetical protein